MKANYLIPAVLMATQAVAIAQLQQARAETDTQSQTLAAQLQTMKEGAKKRLPAEMMQNMTEATKALKASGIEKKARQAGQKAIDAEVMGWDGNKVKLSSLWQEGPVVLMWYRGGWCPYCNLQLCAMQKELENLQGAGAKLVVLTPELPEKAKETAEANDLTMVALHDANNQVARAYGLAFKLADSILPLYRDRLKLADYNGNDSMELPLSATYIIDQSAMIRRAFLDADYIKRAEPAEIVKAVKDLAAEKM